MNAKDFLSCLAIGCLLTVRGAVAEFDLKIEGAVQVSFQTETNKVYGIESSEDVPAPIWTVEGDAIHGDNSRFTKTFLTGATERKIFRVVEISLTNGLIAFYPFSGNANDVSTNHNNASVFGATLTTNRFGNPQSAYQFNGTTHYLSAPHQAFLNFTNNGDFTISLWSLLNTPQTGGVFINKDNAGGNFPKWMFIAGGVPNQTAGMRIHFHINGPPQWFATPLYTPPPNIWQHYLVRKTGSEYSIFINGVLISTSVSTNPISNQITAPLVMGKAGEGGGFLKGQIDDIRIFNRALSQSEINALNAIQE